MPSPSPEKLVAMQEHRSLTMRFHSELARYSTWLFGAVIVAMTFLLLAGLRSPKTLLLVFMYIALGSFALSLVFYLLNGMMSLRLVLAPTANDDKKDKDAANADRPTAASAARVFRVLQQALFLLGIVAMVGFAVEVALLFFPAASAAPAAAAGAQ